MQAEAALRAERIESAPARHHFRLRTLHEASDVARSISSYFPDPLAAFYGLSELLINAIEHGNLSITYEEKVELLRHGKWQEEIERRLSLPANRGKYVRAQVSITPSEVRVSITDEGHGFSWREFAKFSPERRTSIAGRGIATTIGLGFANINYSDTGNAVECLLVR